MDLVHLSAELRRLLDQTSTAVTAVYLFGSEARGTARVASDVDLAILFERAPEATLSGQPFELEAALEARLGRSVQIIALNAAPADLTHRVLRDGRLLIENDRSARIRFEVRARNEYFDLEPIRRAYRRDGPQAA